MPRRYYEDMYYGAPGKYDKYDVYRRNSPYGPHGLWYDPTQRRDKSSNPYNYDAFFVFGDHESIKDSHADYTDRMSQWDHKKFREACKAMNIVQSGPWSHARPASVDKFLEVYYPGEDYECTGLVEWCNQATGYPLWSVHYRKRKSDGTSKQSSE